VIKQLIPHAAEQCWPERAALLCAFHRGKVCPRGVRGEGGALGPRRAQTKGRRRRIGGGAFSAGRCQAVSEGPGRTRWRRS
jgi:hypothetical protein